jgi:eukaryotic-like serine/threonine-protein kinase
MAADNDASDSDGGGEPETDRRVNSSTRTRANSSDEDGAGGLSGLTWAFTSPSPLSVDFPNVTRRVGRFEIQREIGRGGYGIVFLARDPSLDRFVAVKVARPESVADDRGVARFRRESKAAATLDHPGIVSVLEYGEDQGTHFYVMPYIDQPNLHVWLSRQPKPFSQTQAAMIVREIAEAIHFGHQSGIIHRDLKPQNILVPNDPASQAGVRPVVLDFGLCSPIGTDHSTTSILAGTPHYMAPEQALFGARMVTPQSDIYALGVILYQLLTDTTPFQPESIAEAVLMLHNAEALPPSHLRSDIWKPMDAICMKCLRKDPQRRYASAEELATDLTRFLEGKSILARRAGWLEKLDFAVRMGGLDILLGRFVMAMNVTNALWTFLGLLCLKYQLPDHPSVIAGFWNMLTFLIFGATPMHVGAFLLGRSMTRRTRRSMPLVIGAVGSGLWACYMAAAVVSGSEFSPLYREELVGQVMVLTLIGAGYTVQAFALAAGAWAARYRALFHTASHRSADEIANLASSGK